MGTSNWQNIPFCIETLMKIAPMRALDVGVGFGRWGMIVREFCDVWYGRVLCSDWQVHIEGVEGFASSIDKYHHSFYNKIHIGDFRAVIRTLNRHWDVVIFGDVLEHFEKVEAIDLLNWALANSDYVLVNIPLGTDWPQEDVYQNPFERHLSTWNAGEFQALALRRQALFHDYIDRLFGSFVLSRQDPKNLTQRLFSQNTAMDVFSTALVPPTNGSNASFEKAQLLTQVCTLTAELEAIKQSRSYRIIKYLQYSRLNRPLLRLLKLLLPDRNHAEER